MSPSLRPPAVTGKGPSPLLARITAVAAAWSVAFAVMIVVEAYVPLPLGDQWWYPTLSEHLDAFFHQHNEHRIVVPRVLFMIDLILFNGSNIFNFLSILAIQLGHALILAFLAARAAPSSSGGPAWALGFTLSVLFWGYQTENLAGPFQAQFVGVIAAATAAFAALARAATPEDAAQSGRWLATAIGCAGVAVFTMANGVLAPVLLVSMAALAGRPRRELAILGLAAIALIGLYLWGYHSPGHHADPLDALLHHPRAVLVYTLVYLGGPLGWLPMRAAQAMELTNDPTALSVPLALAFGAAGLALALALVIGLARHPAWRTPARLALLHVLAMVAGTAALTALGRINFPADQALTGRYGTPAIVFWAALALLAGSLPAPRLGRVATFAAIAWTLAVTLTQPIFFNDAKTLGEQRLEGAAAIVSKRMVPMLVPYGYPAASEFWTIERLQARHLALFAEPWTSWLGTPLAAHVPSSGAKACGGAIATVEPVASPTGPTLRLTGWARREGEAGRPRVILLTDGDGRIVGYGLAGFRLVAEGERKGEGEDEGERTGWRGFAAIDAATTLSAYLLDPLGGQVCRLGAPWPVAPGEEIVMIAPGEAGPAITVPPPSLDGQWIADGYNRTVGASPLPGAVFGSWVDSDANTGRLRWTVPVAGLSALALPVVTGPDGHGLSVRVVDPRDGTTLAGLRDPVGLINWQIWKVPLPADRGLETVEILAEDAGGSWGQWLALGSPHGLR